MKDIQTTNECSGDSNGFMLPINGHAHQVPILKDDDLNPYREDSQTTNTS